MELKEALDQLPIDKKAKRLRVLWPLIEAKLAEGVSHAAVLELLNRNGLALTEGVYKMYLHRFRKAHRTTKGASANRQTVTPQATSAVPPAAGPSERGRPATFDYDPRGIPDLLK